MGRGWNRRGLGRSRAERTGLLLLLLLLLELLLELLGYRRHRRSAGLETLLRRGLSEAGELRLELSLTLRLQPGLLGLLGLHTGEASILLLERSLTIAGGLRSKGTWLLLLLLLRPRLLAASHAKRASILLRAWAQAIGATKIGVRVRIHGVAAMMVGDGELDSEELGDYVERTRAPGRWLVGRC